MKLLKPDHDTRYEVPGVPGLVQKPVNLDGAALGFTRLRSLRLYCFQAGSVIDGHAEDDEVFVIVTAGSVQIEIGFSDDVVDGYGTFTLSASGVDPAGESPVAYLPPHSVYRMTPHTDADVFYARATPSEVREPAIFSTGASTQNGVVATIVQDEGHAECLRFKLLRIVPDRVAANLQLVDFCDASCEALLHVQGTPTTRIGNISRGEEEPLKLESWDTIALSPGEKPILQVEPGSVANVVVVMAC